MRFTKALLKKSPLELTDEELRCIGEHFLRHPRKDVRKAPLCRCIACKNLDMSRGLWECMATGKWLNKRNWSRQITVWRRCEYFKQGV